MQFAVAGSSVTSRSISPAVFSVYGLVGTDPYPTIYHTNKAQLDDNDSSSKDVISTFAVTIPADTNRDLKVDFADFALMAQSWLTGAH